MQVEMLSLPHLICINLLVDTIGWSLCEPALQFVYSSMGLSGVGIGYLDSLVSVIVLVFGIVHSYVVNYVGKFNMLLMSAFFQFVGQLFYLAAIRNNSVSLLLIARCLPAIGKCATMVSQALMFEVSELKNVSTDQGLLLAASNLSFVVGPLIGGLYDYNHLLPFYAGLVTSAMNLGIVFYLKNSVTRGSKTSVSSLKLTNHSPPPSNHLWYYMMIRAVFQLNNLLYEKMFTRHAKTSIADVNAVVVSLLVAYASGLSVLVSFITPRLLPWFLLPEKFLLPLVVTMSVGLYGWALSRSMWLIVASVTVTSVSSNLFLSITSSVIAQSQKEWEANKINSVEADSSEPSSSRTSSTASLTDSSSASSPRDTDPASTTSGTNKANSSLTSWLRDQLSIKGGTSLFGKTSNIDRFIRILTPTLGSWAVEYGGGDSMGLVYLTSLVSVCSAVLISIILPDRSEQLKNKKLL